MQTIGYWCDECRLKYVRHACKEGLPCGHDKGAAVAVYAKAYATRGEQVILRWTDPEGDHYRELWVYRRARAYRPHSGAPELWEYLIEVAHHVDAERRLNINLTQLPPCAVGAWLWSHPEIVIRAFFARWDSNTTPPAWRVVATIPAEHIRLLARSVEQG